MDHLRCTCQLTQASPWYQSEIKQPQYSEAIGACTHNTTMFRTPSQRSLGLLYNSVQLAIPCFFCHCVMLFMVISIKVEIDWEHPGIHRGNLAIKDILIPITLETTRGIWTRQNRHKPEGKSVIDYILTDKDTHNQVEETIVAIVDEEGTHRIKGTHYSDHTCNTILITLNINIIHKPEKKDNLDKGDTRTMDTLQQYNKGGQKQKKDLTKYNELEKMVCETLKEAIETQTITNTNKIKINNQLTTTKHLIEIRNNWKNTVQTSNNKQRRQQT